MLATDAKDAPSGLFDRSRAIRSSRLPAGAKLVLEAIADCGEECFLKQSTISAKLGMSLRAVSKWVSWLKEAGVIDSIRTGRSSRYSIEWESLESIARDTHDDAYQMRTSVRIRCARSGVSDAHDDAYQMRTSVRIALDSINGLSNDSSNAHLNAGGGGVVSLEEKAKQWVRRWYSRTNRFEPAHLTREVDRVCRLWREHGEEKMAAAADESVAWVTTSNKGIRYLAGDLGRIEQRLEESRRRDNERRQREDREYRETMARRAKEAAWQQEQKGKWDHWQSLPESERQGRMAATRAGMPKGSFNEAFVEIQSIAEAWEDHLARSKGKSDS